METVKKIVVIGPESTGKSTLCEKLAEHYNTLWVPEYAREYLEKNGTEYSYDDLLIIAKGQIELEEDTSLKVQSSKFKVENTMQNFKPSTSNHQSSTLLFIDTDMYVM